jgi:Tol biopolymer transport system component
MPAGVRVVYADLNALWAVDRDGGVRKLVQAQGINMPQLSPDQQWIVYRIYTASGLQVWAIRWEGGDPKLLLDDATLPQDNLPEGYARRGVSDTRWAPKGNVLAVTLSLVPDPDSTKLPTVELWQLDVATGEFKPSSQLGSAWRPYYSPDGKSYLVLQYGSDQKPEGKLTLVDAKSGKGKTVFSFPASPGKNGYDNQVSWAADSKAAYVAIPTGDYGTPTPPNGIKLYRVSAGGAVKEVGEVDATHVFWSPTASAMAYVRYLDETMAKNELYVANADGSQSQLYASMNEGAFISWSPKGTHFLYQDNFQIFVGALGQAAKKLANATSIVNARWISESTILASHDTIDGWLLVLRDIDGSATGLLPLPRESMWDVQSH